MCCSLIGRMDDIITDEAEPNSVHCSDFKAVIWSAHCPCMHIVDRLAKRRRGWNYCVCESGTSPNGLCSSHSMNEALACAG